MRMLRFTKIAAVLVAIFAALTLSAQPANANGWSWGGKPPQMVAAPYAYNTVINHVQPSNYAIGISNTNPYSWDYNIWPGQSSANSVWCFKPALTSHSYWGYTYWGGTVYCFNTQYNTLTLYSGVG